MSCLFTTAVGVYVKSSEALNVVGNMVASNRAAGVAIVQSAQLTRLVSNCVHGNGRAGITVDRECRVELRGNGIYGNSYHGVCFRGDGQIVENDVAGNGAVAVRLIESADVKVSFGLDFTDKNGVAIQYIEINIYHDKKKKIE